MHIVVMRFVFTVYLIGLAWIFYHSLSELLFSENVKFSTRLGKFFKKVIFFIHVAPFAVFRCG